jgi:hypothetical protein
MKTIETLVYLTSAYPLARAWLAVRGTTLFHAMGWATAAWLAWFGALLFSEAGGEGPGRYLALCLTACAAMAPLGARRPIAGTWNFVLLGLLAVLLLPWMENALRATPILDPVRLVFVIATVFVGVLNYLATRFGMAALLVGAACFIEISLLKGWVEDAERRAFLTQLSCWLVTGSCWAAMLSARRRWAKLSVFDQDWLRFRDRFGLMWGQRIREQFNRAAANASWRVQLHWRGLRKVPRGAVVPAEDQVAIVQTLREMLKRFESEPRL